MPLIQEVDFELPFGGAMFRHVRTYSTHPHQFQHPDDCPNGPDAYFWDWNGLGWMMGESPILLIDAAYADIVANSPRRCYLIADAHHSIPFELHPDGTYIAPPQFDARLSHNGQGWAPEADGWQTPPTEFTVWLYGGSVRYFFVTQDDLHGSPGNRQYSDIPDVRNNGVPVSAHARPDPLVVVTDGSPQGIPRYALLSRIEDQNGNVAKITYCGVSQSALDDLDTECAECLQNCTEKGQIKGIHLYAASDLATPVWTLLYTYRSFWGAPYTPYSISSEDLGWWGQLGHEEFIGKSQNALHSIHVYQGNRTLPTSCTVLGTRHFIQEYDDGVWGSGFTSLNQIDQVEALALVALPSGEDYSNWVYEAKYHYSERARDLPHSQLILNEFGYPYGPPTIFDAAKENRSNGYHPTLLKATVTKRLDASGQGLGHTAATSDVTVYRYARAPDDHDTDQLLQSVYYPETVRSILSGTFSQQPEIPLDAGANALLYLNDDTLITLTDSATSLDIERPFRELADLRFECATAHTLLFSRSEICAKMLDEISEGGSDPESSTLLTRNPETSVFASRRNGGAFRIHQFLVTPEARPLDAQYVLHSFTHNLCRSMLHHPYRWRGMSSGDADGDPALPLDQTTWITVLDKFPTLEDARLATQFVPSSAYRPTGRRVIKMNAAGHVLSDREWTFSEDGEGELVGTLGASEELVFDANHGYRLKSRRTFGFTSPENSETSADNGLIYNYYYDDEEPFGDLSRHIREVRVQRGEQGDEFPISRIERENEDWRELVTAMVVFDDDGTPNQTSINYQLEDLEIPLPDGRSTYRIRSKWTVDPPAPAAESGPDLHPVSTEYYDIDGRVTWAGQGLVASTTSFPAQGDLFHLNYTAYDEYGRTLYQIVDTVPGQGVTARRGSDEAYPYDVPAHPENLDRQDARTPPLNHVTAYAYSSPLGLSEIYHPNGYARVITYSQLDIDRMEQRTYERVVFPAPGHFNAMGGGQSIQMTGSRIEHIRGFRPVAEARVLPTGVEGISPNSIITPTYDAAGRITGISIEEAAGGASVGASVAINDLGMVVRELAPDGTITRTVRDPLGRPVKVYRGTTDKLIYWGYPPGTTEQDNLTLIEKRVYGVGVHDAGKLVKTVAYRDLPADRYGDASTEDQIGWETVYRYDWRMREVWVEERTQRTPSEPTGTPIRHTLTWLDNQDRVRLVAVFGPVPPVLGVDADPTSLTSLPAPIDMPDLVGEILATGPLSLSETIYNDRGEVEEQRSYNTDSTNATDYLATTTFYDHQGRAVWTRSPGGGVRTMTYDAKGRQVESTLTAAGVEVTRTRTTFDADDNALIIAATERTHDGAGSTLDGTNSVTTYTFQWHDQAGRLIAMAECGTAHDSDTFTAATPPTGPPTRPEDPPQWDPHTLTFDASNLPPGVRVTTYGYDDAGRQNFIRHPGGATTQHVFDGLGRVVLTTERSPDGLAVLVQTGYRFDNNGQLVEMAAVLPSHVMSSDKVNWSASDGSLQRTEFRYGADVVSQADPETVISRHNGWIGSVHFPDLVTGKPRVTPDLVFTYYPDGLLATRTDARGVRFVHRYDERDLRVQTDVNDPRLVSSLIAWVKDQQSRITYLYNPLGDLTLATARTVTDAQETIISQNLLEYDGFGNLLREWQSHGEQVDTGPSTPSPSVAYTWSFSPASAGNHNRLTGMTYPAWTQTTRQRSLTFRYGHPTSDPINDELDRITGVLATEHAALATYAYTGSGRRVESIYAPAGSSHAARQSFARHHGSGDPPIGYPQLNRFGEVRDLHFTRPAGGLEETLHRYRYAYDTAGNRTHAHVQQWPVPPALLPADNLSHKYEYDAANRLLAAAVGTVDLGANPDTDPQPSMASLAERRRTDWGLDRLGNWAGASPATPYGTRLSGDADLDGVIDATLDTTHLTDLRNQIGEIQTTVLGGTPQSRTLIYDACGNLVCDGPGSNALLYQYDAWNRLVQVSRRGTAVLDASGVMVGGTPGPWLVHLTYDAMGRLIRRQVPWDPGYVAVKAESYYYDGVRRIQEVWREPLPTAPGGGPTGIGTGTGPGGGGGTPPPSYAERTEREYIHSPGYVDEYICSIAGDNQPVYILQDANYTVVGLLEPDGDVLAQYTWDPYGRPLAAQILSAHADNRIGHQGLFSLRLDGFALSGLRTLRPDAVGIYHNVNRTYDPQLGRFLQRDPNVSGQPTLSVTAMHGLTTDAPCRHSDPQAMYADGMSLYAYLGSTPVGLSDPSGLFFGSVGLGVATGLGAALDANGTLADAQAGLRSWFGLFSMIEDYSFNQLHDAYWAEDWNWDDQDYAFGGHDGWLAAQGGAYAMDGGESSELAYASRIKPWQFVKGVNRVMRDHGHHLIPKFMGGLSDGSVYPLSRRLHISEFHPFLNRQLKEKGFPAANDSDGWKAFLRAAQPGDIRTLRRTLYQSTQAFDNLHGTRMTGYLLREIRQQRWLK